LKNIPDIPSSIRGDVAKLRHWDLIVSEIDVKGDGPGRVGFYGITYKGVDFVKGGEEIPRHVLIYNNQVRGFSEEYTNIKKALSDRFSYDELMSKEVPLP